MVMTTATAYVAVPGKDLIVKQQLAKLCLGGFKMQIVGWVDRFGSGWHTQG
jgi:hypothetical protein